MDFSFEGLRKQALVMFSTTQMKRMTLPPKRTPEVDKNAEEVKSLAIHGVRSNHVFCEWVKNAFAHNKSTPATGPLAIIVIVFPQQCTGNVLENLETLGSQMMFVPLEGLENINVPEATQRFKDIARVFVRVELFFTQEEDVKRADICIIDPEARLPLSRESDMKAVVNRTHRMTGIPKEIISAIATEAMKDPEAIIRAVSPHVDMQKVVELSTACMRVCSVCSKYGYSMGKCGGCKKVYYCSKDCQNQDWKTHRTICKKE